MTDPLTAARAALAAWDAPLCGKTWTTRLRDDDGWEFDHEQACTRAAGHDGDCDATGRRKPGPEHLRAAIAAYDESRRQWSIERDLVTEAKRALGDAHDWPDLAEGVRRLVAAHDALRVERDRLRVALTEAREVVADVSGRRLPARATGVPAAEMLARIDAALHGPRDALAGRGGA